MSRNRIFMVMVLSVIPSFAAASATAATGLLGAAQSNAPVEKRMGTIKAISGSTITLSAESGSELTATVQPSARILRLAPGDKDLKNATSLQLQDLHVGDMIRVRGMAPDAKSFSALEVLVITSSTVDAVRDQIRQDWQKRGLGGLVSVVDPASGTVSISVMGFAGKKTIAVHTSKSTVFRRYAPDSVKFEDASPGSLAEIRPGDQLRARGERNAEGSEFSAEEVVSGSFRNIAGTVNAVDASAGTLTVQDVLSKKPVQVKVTSDSELHQLPAEMAQRIAARFKAAIAGALPPGTPGAGAASAQNASANATGGSNPSGGVGAGTPGGGTRGGGPPDLNQVLRRMPAVALTDLHKGDAVMMVTTQGTPSSGSVAITLLSGVEPILQAAPSASQAMMLTPWSLGGMPGGDAGNQ